ncbi:hypothetical protein P9D34_13440 [Bacillus swezeyi]|uniref:Uncharacterized protein n=1 Tax=Bacillus swezeyi TaxID=1925020 RepID=A0A1R1QPT5_9BACI|nr:hypothetical protein [Bacillus swezeyi]MEC1261436.1 hypothetical protein [Bacillus swezeyi]MED2926701.1 hypothetical protein [Bacillus swezeyi]MED2944174.1 hypothetical protein [Bacillus swezeyi]MED2965737.1 hypothetical protein [Bacillus swezeyi]MED3070860.1 hypothetical protein [Bacillus swezeyi]
MNDSNEKIEFGEIKSVLGYLEQVKEDVHKKSLSEQIAFKEEIKKHHDKKQIQMFLGRLEDQFEIKKAISYLTAAFFAIISLAIGSTMDHSLSIIKEYRLNLALASDVIIFLFLVSIGAWAVLSKMEAGRLGKISGYKRLLQECLDELPEKRHFRRVHKSTRHLTK